MSVTISNAFSGMQTAQSAISVESHNIANARTDGFTKKTTLASSKVLNNVGAGVALTTPQRIVDTNSLIDERVSLSSHGYLSTKFQALASLQRNLGEPGGQNSLGERIKEFSNMCKALDLEPTSGLKRKEVLRTLDIVTQELSKLTERIQDLRRSSDTSIKVAVDEINAQLTIVDTLNTQIVSNSQSGLPTGDLTDKRDEAIRQITQRMNLSITENTDGSVSLRTGEGVSLVKPDLTTIDFTPTTYIGPASRYDPILANSDISHITVSDSASNLINITDGFTGGEIAGHIEMRDQYLPNLQEQLDRLATDLRDKLNADHNLGTGYPPANTLTGNRPFATPAADTFQGTGTIRVAIVDRATGQFVGVVPYDLDLTATGAITINNLATNLDTGLGAAGSATVNASGNLVLSATNADHGVALIPVGGAAVETGTGTGLGFSHYFGLNDLVTSQQDLYTGGAPTPGVAGMLGVRQDIVTDDTLLSRGKISDALVPLPLIGDQALYNGDNRSIRQLVSTLDASHTFADAGGLGVRTSTFENYASLILADSAQTTLNTEKLMEDERSNLAIISYAQGQISGVDIQGSLLKVIEWQKVYMGCSTIIRLERENSQALMRILD